METEKVSNGGLHALLGADDGIDHTLEAKPPPVFGVDQLKRLFRDQQQFLDYFFKNLDYEQVNPPSLPLKFRIVCLCRS